MEVCMWLLHSDVLEELSAVLEWQWYMEFGGGKWDLTIESSVKIASIIKSSSSSSLNKCKQLMLPVKTLSFINRNMWLYGSQFPEWTWHHDILTDWLTVCRNMTLTLTIWYTVQDKHWMNELSRVICFPAWLPRVFVNSLKSVCVRCWAVVMMHVHN
jgi:hypothetical protein